MRSIVRSSHPTALGRLTLALSVAALVSACGDAETPLSVEPEQAIAGSMHAMGQASKRTFTAHLDGAQEVPAVETAARGEAVFRVSRDGTEISYRLIVANLHDVLMAHIHVADAGVNGPVVVWLYPSAPPPALIEGRSSGVLATGVITEGSLVGPWTGEPLETLIDAMRNEAVYVNVHTLAFGGGEIRGQIR